jgi:FkbH-like protein
MLSFSELRKNLKKETKDLKTVKLALLADSASQFIHQAIKGYGIALNLNIDIYEADYNQIDRQVYDPSSELYEFKPDFVVVIRSIEHLLNDFYQQASRVDFFDKILNETEQLHNQITAKCGANIISNTFIEINDMVFGNYATDKSFIYQLRKINIGLMDMAQKHKAISLVDAASLSATKGYEATFDPKMYVNADMVFSIDFLPLLAQHIVQIINSLLGNFKKCLILDLDNTLWGGIIGDDGVEGIQIGHLGIGKAFTQLQLWCKELKNRGIILAVCSKNTEAIALEPFTDHPEMELRRDDIAVFVANWENKVDNIKYIQSVLNIGFDSMVFLDDNPFEREMVKSGIPDLTVPDLPEDPAEYLLYLRTLNLFETASVTEEDEQRTVKYHQEAQRTILQNSFGDEQSFLENLAMVSEVKGFNKFNIPRVVQLILRSNQFNLRTVRHSETDIEHIVNSPDYFPLTFTLADKFGDHGLISVVILKKQSDDTLFIDTWIMSCRVLKRTMENFVLNRIVEIARDAGFKKITGEYIPTKKNQLVKDHFSKLGFTAMGDIWELNVNDFTDNDTFIKTT